MCWGSTGKGAATYRPVPAVLSGFRDVQAGLDYSCGTTLEFGMLCWGAVPSGSPTAVNASERWQHVAAGPASWTCAIREDLSPSCWGAVHPQLQTLI